jgi:hypothetical protein
VEESWGPLEEWEQNEFDEALVANGYRPHQFVARRRISPVMQEVKPWLEEMLPVEVSREGDAWVGRYRPEPGIPWLVGFETDLRNGMFGKP